MEVNEKKWYAVKVQANHEKSVSQRIKSNIIRGEITHVSDILVPMEKTYFVKNGKRVFRERIIFPGYIYVQTDSVNELQHNLKQVTGATGFVKSHSGEIQPIRKADMERIMDVVTKSQNDDGLSYVVGDSVKILDTAFEGLIGSVVSINEETQKVKVAVKIWGKTTEIDLTMIQIEKEIQ